MLFNPLLRLAAKSLWNNLTKGKEEEELAALKQRIDDAQENLENLEKEMFLSTLESAKEDGYLFAYNKYEVGEAYLEGKVVEQDYKQAIDWFKQAAELDYVEAQIKLGEIYYDGIYTEKDIYQALYWYEKAVNNRYGCNYHAKNIVGSFYLYGTDGIKQDVEKGIEYLKQAADYNSLDAIKRLAAYFYKQGDYIQAKEYALKGVEYNDPHAQFLLASIEAFIHKENVKEYVSLFAMSAENGYEGSQEILISMENIGEASYQAQIMEGYLQAEKENKQHSEIILGCAYLFGTVTPKDYEKARYFLEKSAEKGNSDAQYYLGMIYEDGLGVAVDLDKAKEYYRKAGGLNAEVVDFSSMEDNEISIVQIIQKYKSCCRTPWRLAISE